MMATYMTWKLCIESFIFHDNKKLSTLTEREAKERGPGNEVVTEAQNLKRNI